MRVKKRDASKMEKNFILPQPQKDKI